jgi:NitT/TauT family transport system substrate-binding protein
MAGSSYSKEMEAIKGKYIMVNLYKKIIALITALCIIFIAGSCEYNKKSSLDNINYRLKWLFNISSAGDIWADAHGHFQEQGLMVTVKPGGPERDAIKELELGQAHFGVASADQVIRAVSKGAPIVVLAQIFQVNPLQWIYRPNKINIELPIDLKGKTIGVTFGGNDETIMKALLAQHQIDENEVELFSVRYDYTPFYKGKVDLWPIYRNAQAVIIGNRLQDAGEQIAFFDPHKAGTTFVANSVVTTQKILAEHPETVKKFMDALLMAWKESMDPANKEKVVETVHRFDTDTPIETINEQLEITRNLTVPSGDFAKGGKFFGKIDSNAWKDTEKIMLDQKLIPKPIKIENYLKPGS